MSWPIQLILKPSVSSNLSYTFRDTRYIVCDYSTTTVHDAATEYCRRPPWAYISDPLTSTPVLPAFIISSSMSPAWKPSGFLWQVKRVRGQGAWCSLVTLETQLAASGS